MTKLLQDVLSQPVFEPLIVPQPQEQATSTPAVRYVGRSAVVAHNQPQTPAGYPEAVDPWPDAEFDPTAFRRSVIAQANNELSPLTPLTRVEASPAHFVASLTPAQLQRRRSPVPVIPGYPDVQGPPLRPVSQQPWHPEAKILQTPPEIDAATQQDIITRLRKLTDTHDSTKSHGAHNISSAARMLLHAVGNGPQGPDDATFKRRLYDAKTFVDHLDQKQ